MVLYEEPMRHMPCMVRKFQSALSMERKHVLQGARALTESEHCM
jgi:hypothetical protein